MTRVSRPTAVRGARPYMGMLFRARGRGVVVPPVPARRRSTSCCRARKPQGPDADGQPERSYEYQGFVVHVHRASRLQAGRRLGYTAPRSTRKYRENGRRTDTTRRHQRAARRRELMPMATIQPSRREGDIPFAASCSPSLAACRRQTPRARYAPSLLACSAASATGRAVPLRNRVDGESAWSNRAVPRVRQRDHSYLSCACATCRRILDMFLHACSSVSGRSR